MPNNGRITLCPYYRNESGLTISCEDVIRRFRWLGQKKKYMDTYCDDKWQMCPYAMELTRLYEEGEDMSEHEVKALNKELKKTVTMLGRSQRREAAKDDTIKELRRKCRAWEKRYQELNAKVEQQRKNERKAFDQIQGLTQMYEARFAYLMSEFNCGELDEKEVEKWSEGKEFAIVADKKDDQGHVTRWRVIVRDEHESGRSESKDEGSGNGKIKSPGGEEKKQGY